MNKSILFGLGLLSLSASAEPIFGYDSENLNCDYKLVSMYLSNDNEEYKMEEVVNQWIVDGYRPIGGAGVSAGMNGGYSTGDTIYQSMIKCGKSDKEIAADMNVWRSWERSNKVLENYHRVMLEAMED